jgi:ABC-type multidrug transport system fused ATPase/permease subunit
LPRTDPTLFTGTIRSNLDPFGLFTDDEIFTSLQRVHLIDSSTSTITPDGADTPRSTNGPSSTASRSNKNVFLNLDSPVTESGNNLSQGQKQLLCLARAMLKQPKVILMDEATASIDYNTDARIQTTIRELDSTTITIAHRLQTIIDYDKVLVLDKGEVKEYDHPWTLLQDKNSIFRSMCEMSGELDTLEEGAKKAWIAAGHQLVDVE